MQIVVNGEFYGYREIRDRLRAGGCPFKTESDSEIALHVYLREGMNLGRHLRGEFAAVIADRRNGAMLAIRDRFGIKPLFYSVHEGNVYFGSEVKALLALGVRARWNREAVSRSAFPPALALDLRGHLQTDCGPTLLSGCRRRRLRLITKTRRFRL